MPVMNKATAISLATSVSQQLLTKLEFYIIKAGQPVSILPLPIYTLY